ncbi:DUF3300 domain-containing protein [Aliiglaciecola litoralis]|uniref:DUF3300 domain-containing protein n=1 Tax=Aliiglaciecola litoralis TaxID=582857 RepID=A0ABP3WUX4_9ALTE
MQHKKRYVIVYLCLLGVIIGLAINLAQAQEQQVISVESAETADDLADSDYEYVELDQAELDQMLAPIALYPDSVLSHVLVASTYPLEVIQAARWRQNNLSLSEQEAIDGVADQDWDPSVKALVPFNELLQQITEDLNWLQDLGDAFLINEQQVLASIQTLRQKAYAQGSLSNNKYIEVIEEDDDIVIAPANREVIYVPYYDTRVVYGNWWWHDHPPYYWHRPAHYYWHAGLYWSPRVYIRSSGFYAGFHWSNRHIVINQYYPKRHYYYRDGVKRVRSHEYQRWQHNPHHRRGVRYNEHTPKVVYRNSQRHDNRVVRTTDGQRRVDRVQRPVQVRQPNADRQQVIRRTEQRLNNQIVRRDNAEIPKRQQTQVQVNQAQTQRQRQPRQVDNQRRNTVVSTVPNEQRQERTYRTTDIESRTTRQPTSIPRDSQQPVQHRQAQPEPRQIAPTQTSRQPRTQPSAPPRQRASRASGQRPTQNQSNRARARSNNVKQNQR